MTKKKVALRSLEGMICRHQWILNNLLNGCMYARGMDHRGNGRGNTKSYSEWVRAHFN